MQVVTDAMVKTPQPGDPSYEVFNKVGVPPTPHTYAVKWRATFYFETVVPQKKKNN